MFNKWYYSLELYSKTVSQLPQCIDPKERREQCSSLTETKMASSLPALICNLPMEAQKSRLIQYPQAHRYYGSHFSGNYVAALLIRVVVEFHMVL
jgi:hypothetical protein